LFEAARRAGIVEHELDKFHWVGKFGPPAFLHSFFLDRLKVALACPPRHMPSVSAEAELQCAECGR